MLTRKKKQSLPPEGANAAFSGPNKISKIVMIVC